MNRRDAHMDAMLRHLGAAYYDSLHGRASASDVARALSTVAERVGEAPYPAAHPEEAATRQVREPRHSLWHRRVRDVMTTSVVTIDRITPLRRSRGSSRRTRSVLFRC